MSKFNSDLNNLFSNWQNQQKYNKKAYDVNGDGKVNSKDKTQLTNNEKNLLKKSTLFDINGDGKFNQADIDMFIKSDVNGDGEITQEELNFVSAYKKDLTTIFTKQKADFEIDGKKYINGKLATGVYDGKYYKNGVLSDGTANNKKYVKGELAQGVISNILYRDGVTYTGLHTDNKYYKNGKVFTGVVENKYYKNGILSTGTYSGKYYVNGIIANGTYNGKLYTNGALANGVIDNKFYKNGVLSDGTANSKKYVKGELAQGVISNILYRDGVTYTGLHTDNKYYKNGKVFTGTLTDKETNTTTNYKSGVLQYEIVDKNDKNYPNITGNSIKFQDDKKYVTVKLLAGEKAVINEDGTVQITSKDENTKKLYMTNGSLVNGIVNNIMYQNGVIANGIIDNKLYQKGTLVNGVIDNKLYKDGTLFNGIIDNKMYQNGEIANGTIDGKLYQNGVLANGIVDDKMYKNGNLYSGKIDNKYYFMGDETKDEVTVCGDNNIRVISEDGNTLTKYYADGSFMYSMTREDAVNQLNRYTKNYINALDSAIVNDRLFKDLDIINTAEYLAKHRDRVKYPDYYEIYSPSIKAQMISTPENMKNEVGEVVEKEDGLYVNDGNSLVKLNISAGTYLRLFPPKARYQLNQGTGDCFLVSACLIDMIKSPKAFSQVLQMFSEKENGDIEIELKGSFKEYSPINFENGEFKSKSPVIGSTGIRMLEQAYAIANFAYSSQKLVEQINIDEAIESISNGGRMDEVYEEILGIKTDLDGITFKEVPEVNINETGIKRDAEKYESHIIDFLENRIKYTECCSIFDNYDYMTDNVKQMINVLVERSDILKFNLHINNEIWEACYIDKTPDVEKFKRFLDITGFNKIETARFHFNFDLNDSQWADIITLLNETDYKKIYGDYSLSEIHLSADLRNSRNTVVGNYIRDAWNSSDIIEMKNCLNTIKSQNFYEIVLESETKKQTENKLKAEINNENTIKTLENLSKLIEEDKILVSVDFRINENPKQDLNKYNIIENHAFSIERIDTENQIIYTNNPHYAGGKIAVPYSALQDMECALWIGYLE